MIEDVININKETIQIISAAAPWQHIRPIGEDIVANEMIIPSHHQIRPIDIGALLSGGITSIKVFKKPKVAIIPTGTEIIEPGQKMEVGSIIESNSRVFEGLVYELGGQPNRYLPIPDDYDLLKAKLLEAVMENDIVIINAGSSAGREDYTSSLIKELGEVLIHGIATKPGKPTILGIIKDKPVIGIPGYPVSGFFVFETFVQPLINSFLGQKEERVKEVEAIIAKRIVSSLQYKEFVRIKLGKVGDRLIATPLSRGAGVTMSLVRADGTLVIPQNSEGVEAGEKVKIKLLKDMEQIENTLVSIGSHDLIMDIISNRMQKSYDKHFLSSAHVGSMGGIMALKRGETHIAPIHLLDTNTGEYNISYAKRYLPNKKLALIKGVKRIQGFMVPKGNPKDIKDFKDLTRKDIIFVNRQRGAGTRILVDYQLEKFGINGDEIVGYDREMTTHMAVAAAITSGTADVGVGVYSAAKAMDLDFIPIGEEHYDFLILVEYLENELTNAFLEVIRFQDFKEELLTMGGYGVEEIGEIIPIK
jgi:putative molybdopterin biosynthesis protein